MAQRSPAPTFGNWESEEDVSYTAYFEKANKDKGRKRPDPSESSAQAPTIQTEPKPETERGSEAIRRTTESPLHHDAVGQRDVTDSSHQLQGGVRSASSKAELEAPKHSESSMSKEKRGSSQEDNDLGVSSGVGSGDAPKRTMRHGVGSSSVEHSPLHPHHQARLGGRGGGVPSPSRERRSSEGGSHGLAPSTPWRSKPKSVTRGDETPDKGAAVPKFGDWDETNPSSADGYSLIFSKVREERHSGAGRIPVMPTDTSHSNGQTQYTDGDSKRCFCFPWGRK